MADLLELTVAEAAAKIAAGELSAAEYFAAWREAAARRRAERLPLARSRTATSYEVADGPLSGIPVAVKDIFCTEGVADHGRLADPRGLPAALHGDRRAAADARPARRVLGKTNMDEFAMGSSNENSAYGPVLNPWDREPRARRLLGRLGGGRRRRPRALRDRHRHRRLDPPAGRALRDRRPEAHLRGDLALRDDRLRLLARPVRAADPRRHRRGAAAGGACRAATPATRPRSGSRAGSSLPEPRGPQGPALRRPGASSASDAIDAGVRDVFEATAGADRGARRRDRRGRRCRTPSTASPPTT